MDALDSVLALAGLELQPQEADRLRRQYASYRESLTPLFEADLSDEEVAGRFVPDAEVHRDE